MSQAVAEPVAPEVREPKTPDETPTPDDDDREANAAPAPDDDDREATATGGNESPPDERTESIRRIVAAMEGLSLPCLRRIIDLLESPTGKPANDAAPEPPFNREWHNRLERICKKDRTTWWLAIHGRARELDRIRKRLSAAETILETYTDGPDKHMPGWEAVVVEQIVMRAMEWCDDEAKSLYAECAELHAIDKAGKVQEPDESTEATDG